jgi:ABC-type multidrug transport system fused ATPase/permease subunit
MLNSMKVVKMLGIQDALVNRIQVLRSKELHLASRVRWITAYANAVANALGLFSPAAVIVFFSIWLKYARNSNLDPETGFTTLVILRAVTHPANMVMTIYPRVISSLAGFERIQDYLVRIPSEDMRSEIKSIPQYQDGQDWEGSSIQSPAVLQLKDLTVSCGISQNDVLRDINIDVNAAALVVISGPVGSGKTTLLRTILGQIPPVDGSIAVRTKLIAYCSQQPWLSSGSIRNIITGFMGSYDTEWYSEVINSCCLIHDLATLPEADETQVGSQGCNLSGGQKQRVVSTRFISSQFYRTYY